ncbi:MAG: YcaQ family DNA glycosylase [Acholeplasmataceae bacterium]|nr:YcaQ family DNA glycosylase [Acholeplasmataceae bacterium]
MKIIHMTTKEARDFMVSYHLINIKQQPRGKSGLLEVFDRIKSVQYDPLNIVGRNSDLVLQARMQNYTSGLLNDALYIDRTLIDAWDKQMCIYQTKDYPFFNEIRRLRGIEAIQTLKYRLSIEALDYIDEIIEYIREKGPTFSSEINLGETKTHKWGNTKPSSAALDYLLHIGKLGIYKRKNTQKQYDLIENLIDKKYTTLTIDYSEDDFIEWHLLRRISSMGLVSLKNGIMWSGHLISDRKIRDEHIAILVEKEIITKIIVDDIVEPLYCLTTSLERQQTIQKRISFIAPLDNLIWDRNLIKKLFNFDYTWEVYTPAAKRKYGYYVLPILFGSEFIGRIEFDFNRSSKDLKVKNIWWENHIEPTKQILTYLDQSLADFSRYLL